jgi:capsular polysaccharide biosynthesis protein
MSLRAFANLFTVIRAHWFGVVVCCLLGALVATALNMMLPVNYRATTRLFLATPNWNDSTVTGEPDLKGKVYTYAFGDEYTQTRAMTYEELITSPRITSGVIKRLGLNTTPDELAGRLSARVVPDTVLVDIRARDGNPEQAARIANAAADELTALVKDVETPFKELNSPVLPVVIEAATPPTTPESPKPLSNLLIFLTAGLAVGVTYAAVREWYKAAHLPEDLTTSPNTLGVLRDADDVGEFVRLDDVGSELAEDVRYFCLRLTTSLEDAAGDRPLKTVLFAAPRATDTVATTAVLVGAALAELDRRVAIVLTNVTKAGTGNPTTEAGLGEVLEGRRSLTDVLRYDEQGRVAVITAGTVQSSTLAALSSEQMNSVIARLETDFDYVILLGGPLLETADALEVASKAAAAVLICPVPPLSGAEIVEGERLLDLAPGVSLGRVVITDQPGHDDARTDRTDAERRKITADL